MQFSRLRIAGFKSFAEPVSVEIHPGLTGIVGPNGCGKSNVVEALRWAMGEQSTRSLRAGEMDDVIFAGTAGRPSRNLAEVTVTLDETVGAVPPPFHEQAELEIIRRIERGSGSEYRVNGKEVRARDVQTLFADLATGAHSSGMVSQGRVGMLVTAKPEDRRAVLEEAAGITGLHARRHEAELKLRAAEANLARAEDLRGQLEVQLGALKRQARQASRYRNISGAIRQAEAELLSIQRARTEAVRSEASAALHAAGLAVAQATEVATQAATLATEAAAALPPLRSAESDARTALERHRVAQEQLAAEEERARAALADATRRLDQLGHDLAHAEQLKRDSEAAEARLAAEDATLGEAEAGHAARAEAAEAAVAEAAEAARLAEVEANRATEDAAHANARVQTVTRQLAEAEQRWRRLESRFAGLREERDRIAAQAVDPAALEAGAGGAGGGRYRHLCRTGRAGVGRAGARSDRAGAGRGTGAEGGRRGGACQAGCRVACPGGGACGQGWRALAADGRCFDRARWSGNGARRGVGGGTHVGGRSGCCPALARVAAVRSGAGVARRRCVAGRAGSGAVCARACPVADRSGG